MKILCIIPPYIPSYFNAGHHLPVFQVGAYLRKNISNSSVTCIDGAALNMNWKDVCDLLIQQFDVIALMNDFDGIDTFTRFIRYKNEFSPNSKIVTFGRLSKQIPNFFKKYDLDAIVFSGDYENSIESYINSLNGKSKAFGVIVKNNGKFDVEPDKGVYLDPEKWVLPDINDVPYKHYNQMYHNDLNKFCGIPERTELVVPIARGCPVGCPFCDVPIMQGKNERRLSIERTMGYIEESFGAYPFEYVSFYAPTFTLNKKWVNDLCEQLIVKGSPYKWKCVTTTFHLNEHIICTMAKAGCVRISVGLEALDEGGQSTLPKVKKDTETKLDEISRLCKDNNIELNCFVILGLPGHSFEGLKYTVNKVLSLKARVRPTIYTPYHLLKDAVNESDILEFNRQFLIGSDISSDTKMEYYKLFFKNKMDVPTSVMDSIPVR